MLAARSRQFTDGEIGIRISDDPTIQQVNRRHLQHDYPTDVISFLYRSDLPRIEGELIVSVDTARRRSEELGWNTSHELLLYVVHGVLHLTGMDDHNPILRSEMRKAEEMIMTELGIADIVRYGADIDRNVVSEQQS